MLRFDAAHLMKTALAGTSTEKFTNIIQGAFGGIDPPSMRREFDLPDEPEEEDEELLAQIEDPPTAETSIPSTSTLSITIQVFCFLNFQVTCFSNSN